MSTTKDALKLARNALCDTDNLLFDAGKRTPDFVEQAIYAIDTALAMPDGWQPISTAPKETEVLLWREDAGAFTGKFTSIGTFCSDFEADAIDEELLFAEDWFYGDFRNCGRLEGSELPTHWQPLPKGPEQS